MLYVHTRHVSNKVTSSVLSEECARGSFKLFRLLIKTQTGFRWIALKCRAVAALLVEITWMDLPRTFCAMNFLDLVIYIPPNLLRHACRSFSACPDRIFPARHTITILVLGMPPKMAVGTAQMAAMAKTCQIRRSLGCVDPASKLPLPTGSSSHLSECRVCTEMANKDGTWLREICSCCCLTTAGKTRQLLLNKIYIPILPYLYFFPM